MTKGEMVVRNPEGPRRAEGAPAVRPKPSASLILVRRDGRKPRVLMGKRHGGHSFMPERWVFPGGRVDRADYRVPAATELAPETAALMDAHMRPGLGRALALAAIRETWEEAGLLLARPAPPRPGAGPWRSFFEAGAAPDLDALQVAARAITPPIIAKRFDTWFLAADAERLMSLERRPDCGELEEIAWVDFDEVASLKTAGVTRRILDEFVQRLADPSRPRPLLRYRAGGLRLTHL